MDAGERFEISQRFTPCHFVVESSKRFFLSRLQNWKRLDDAIAKRRGKIARRQDIVGEFPMMRALFDDREIMRPPHDLPHLGELGRQHSPEKRSDADVREIIAGPSDRAPARAVVTEFRMIERLLHEPVEAHGALLTNRFANEIGQRLIAREHGYLYRQIAESIHRYIVKGRRNDTILFDVTI